MALSFKVQALCVILKKKTKNLLPKCQVERFTSAFSPVRELKQASKRRRAHLREELATKWTSGFPFNTVNLELPAAEAFGLRLPLLVVLLLLMLVQADIHTAGTSSHL